MKKAWAMLVAVMLLFNLVGMSVFAAGGHTYNLKIVESAWLIKEEQICQSILLPVSVK